MFKSRQQCATNQIIQPQTKHTYMHTYTEITCRHPSIHFVLFSYMYCICFSSIISLYTSFVWIVPKVNLFHLKFQWLTCCVQFTVYCVWASHSVTNSSIKWQLCQQHNHPEKYKKNYIYCLFFQWLKLL